MRNVLLCSLGALALMASASTAGAVVVEVEQLGSLSDLPPGGAVGSNFTKITTTGTYENYLVFTVTGNSPLSFSASETNNGSTTTASFYSSGTLELFKCASTDCGSTGPTIAPTPVGGAILTDPVSAKISVPPGFVQTASFSSATLTTGSYFIELMGTVGAPDHTAFVPSVNLTVLSTVPEPSTWAMLMLGFAGLGYAAFRRSRSPLVEAV
jgi:PEP-CTERM motif